VERIGIIKLGAKGDVIRTTPIAEALKNEYPEAQIVWITKKENAQLLEGQQNIDEVKTLPLKTNEKFSILYNFDIDKEATDLVKSIAAEKKYGFTEDGGYPAAFNPSSEYYLNTVFDDEVKKTNKKTYQEMIFEAAELSYHKEKCLINLTNKDKLYAETFAQRNKISTERLIGIHIGSSSRWPSKAWDKDCVTHFVEIAKKKGYEIIIFAGSEEEQRLSEILALLTMRKIHVYCNSPSNSDREFASLVNICRYIVCSDSFCLHLALALKKKTACLFFVTSPDEVEGYGLLKKMVSPKLYEFFPEKSDQYDVALTRSIKAEDVLDALEH
jgi:ADP-heptose:LPS heptosyltransferase